jgi:hypothetical protein
VASRDKEQRRLGTDLPDEPVRKKVKKIQLPKLEGLAAIASKPFIDPKAWSDSWRKARDAAGKRRLYAANPEKFLEEDRRWRAKNKEKARALSLEYHKKIQADPILRAKRNARVAKRRLAMREEINAKARAKWAEQKDKINAARRVKRDRVNSKGNTHEVASTPLPVCL